MTIYKDYAENLSTFRTEDEEINKLHDKSIEVSLDMYNGYNEIISLYAEVTKLNDMASTTSAKENKIEDIENRIFDQMDHIYNIQDVLYDTLEQY